ncbi:MAG: hypothetical protein AAFQ80_12785 [Cyanobacteria bacterium J06621_8]
MVVMLADEQIFPAHKVCQGCLMSDRHGLPRWHENQLKCGKIIPQAIPRQCKVYQCLMGFKVTQVN